MDVAFHALLRRRQRHAVRPADHRPSFCQVEVFKGLGVLTFPDVLGDNGHAIVEIVGEIGEDKTRVGRVELNPRRQAVERDGFFDPGVHIRRVEQ